jgi:hypothetical protein
VHCVSRQNRATRLRSYHEENGVEVERRFGKLKWLGNLRQKCLQRDFTCTSYDVNNFFSPDVCPFSSNLLIRFLHLERLSLPVLLDAHALHTSNGFSRSSPTILTPEAPRHEEEY